MLLPGFSPLKSICDNLQNYKDGFLVKVYHLVMAGVGIASDNFKFCRTCQSII
jgi:hypothetical protein